MNAFEQANTQAFALKASCTIQRLFLLYIARDLLFRQFAEFYNSINRIRERRLDAIAYPQRGVENHSMARAGLQLFDCSRLVAGFAKQGIAQARCLIRGDDNSGRV